MVQRHRYRTQPLSIRRSGAIKLEPIGEPTKRAFTAFLNAYDKGVLIRSTGDIIALSPPLIISQAQIDELIDNLGGELKDLI
jgi:beta-alanine--pyruvate transaminase